MIYVMISSQFCWIIVVVLCFSIPGNQILKRARRYSGIIQLENGGSFHSFLYVYQMDKWIPGCKYDRPGSQAPVATLRPPCDPTFAPAVGFLAADEWIYYVEMW